MIIYIILLIFACMWKEFKPTIFFLLRFAITYGVLSALYSLYLQPFESDKKPDHITNIVSTQTSGIIELLGFDSKTFTREGERSVYITLEGKEAVSVYQGCNGASMIILFISFVVAFGGRWLAMAWFIPLGILFIHMSNVARISALAYISINYPSSMYFFHKYGFTIVIYAAVFLLWVIWVARFQKNRFKKHAPDQKPSTKEHYG